MGDLEKGLCDNRVCDRMMRSMIGMKGIDMAIRIIEDAGVIEVRDDEVEHAFVRVVAAGVIPGIACEGDDFQVCPDPAAYQLTICDAPELDEGELGPDRYNFCIHHAALHLGLFMMPIV